MSADNPNLNKRSRPDEAAGKGGREGGAVEGQPSVQGEILARLEVIDRRLEERKCPAAGPGKAAFDKLAKTVGTIGKGVGETRNLVGELVESDPDYKAAVDAAVGPVGQAGQLPGRFRGGGSRRTAAGGGTGRRRHWPRPSRPPWCSACSCSCSSR